MTNSTAETADDPSVRATVHETVVRVVSAWAPDPAMAVRSEDHLMDNLEFSSLRLVELAFILEELFVMDPATMGEAPPVGTVGDLAAFLLEKVVGGDAELPDADSIDSLIESMR
ncbi:hypothetical protein GCM10010172_65810 [Paractinoplanes ferrugineus]|uniref:Carrier domain-containing protein n=1 Tax=Paractinoplanes ferrugineus TaxID=113564 RepID=A0A919J593_9ACTN|nr:hypothetical protein [Actinoplanes ferrugineus]GIE13258.1 hypothetical protein Afe05nite_50980 [Actinoplanes ferrugineus]